MAKSRIWGAGNNDGGGDIRRSNPIRDFNKRMGINTSENQFVQTSTLSPLKRRIGQMFRDLNASMSANGTDPGESKELNKRLYG
ncbi:MAG: hypothetical protein OXU45_00485 [Candidatus Melainabacteria bacterium]|nr:hypothetical protein [Candidatus Melainabacteria bacterium]